MATKYVVTGACVTHIPVAGPGGSMLETFYQGALLPAGVPDDRIKHLLDNNLIAAEGEDADEALADAYAPASEPVNPAVVPPPFELPERRPVNGRSSRADLVEHAVQQGMDREEAEGMSREELRDRYVRKPEGE
jgi:hypothetical protein